MDDLSPRERVLRLMRHESVDRMPVTLDPGGGDGIAGPYLKILRAHTGYDSAAEYFDFDIRPVPVPLKAQTQDFSMYHKETPPGTEFDEFGVGRVPSETFPLGMHLSPWQSFTTPQQMLDYPFPGFELTDETVTKIQTWHDRGYAVSVAAGSINEWCYYLRTMEEFMVDLVVNPEMAEILLDKVTDLSTQVGVGMAEAGADIICFYGDVGGQNSMLMSPTSWRKWIKPRWKQIFDAVHRANPEALVFFHSCGYVEPIIPDMIEVGTDILNPIQPEAMDPVKIKRQYGDQVALWGGVGLQSTMTSAASPDVVRIVVRSLIDEWAPGGGGIVTVSNALPVDIPWENVVALVETVKEYSPQVYRRLEANEVHR